MTGSTTVYAVATGTIVTLDTIAQGKPSARPIVSSVVLLLLLALLSQPAPELARSLAAVILITALLTSGADLARRSQLSA